MPTEQATQKELNKIIGVLKQTAELAKVATLSGAFEGGERRCIRQHNLLLKRLQEMEVIPAVEGGFFLPLADDASFGEIAVACAQLVGYLKDKDVIGILTATADLAKVATHSGAFEGGEKRCIQHYNFLLNRFEEMEAMPKGFFLPLDDDASFGEIGVAYAQLVAYLKNGGEDESDSPLKDLKDLGNLIRQAMPDFLKQAKESVSTAVGEIHETERHISEAQVDIAELREQMRALSEQLRQEGLPPDEIQRIAEKIRKLGEAQARLAR
jgi:hypothetical protein